MRDLTYLFHPWRNLAAQMMMEGEMPLWNSYQMGGMPFLANCQSAIFYPFTIFFYIFPFVVALKFFHFIHYSLAGLGFYLFARKRRFGIWSALIGGVIFSFNGYALTRFEFLSVLGSIIWLPWILIFVHQSHSNENLGSAVALGLVFSFSLFAGFPQILILQILTAGLFILIFAKDSKSILFIGLAGVFFLLLGAVQWLPTAELIPHSIRGGGGIAYDEAGTYSLPVDSLLGLIYPYWILDHPHRFTGEKYFWIWSGWWGFITTLLIFLSFKFKQKIVLVFGWTLFFLGLLWSMGTQFNFFETLYKNIFLIRLFRYPPVALYLSVTAAALLASCGMASINWVTHPLKRILPAILGVFLILELYVYSKNIQPTVIPEYFSVTFPAIESVIKDNPGTVMLSPKMEHRRRLAGLSYLEAKMMFRAYFFDLTNLPYRVRTLTPSGEPLALKAHERHYENLGKKKSVEEARPYFKLWNITHFLTNDSFKDSFKNNWELIGTDKDLKAYRNTLVYGNAFAVKEKEINQLAPSDILQAFDLKVKNRKWKASFDTPDDRVALFNVPFYPGWKLFCFNCAKHTSKSIQTFQAYDYFTAVPLKKGFHRLFLCYQPMVWKTALYLTLAAILTIAGLFFFKIHVKLRN